MATNVAINLSRIGLQVTLIATVGYDKAGKNALEHIAREGVDTSGLRADDRDTQRTYIIINKRNASRTVITGHGVSIDALRTFIKISSETLS